MADLHILFLGDGDRAEFRHARRSLDALGRVAGFCDAESAAAALAAEGSADVIIIAEAYPGEFPHSAVDRLRRLAPLARVIALLGSWCEGEMRTGKPWPAAIRVYWHQWPARSERELRSLLNGCNSTWRLPCTATDEDRLLVAAEAPLPKRQGLVVLHTHQAEREAWLAAACRACGFATAWVCPPHVARIRGAAAAIFDGTDFQGRELGELRQFSAMLAAAPVIALADFPRSEDRDRILAAGAAEVLSKPLLIEDLAWAFGLGPTN
jgi:hypothetical protein